VEQELPILPEHQSSLPVLTEVHLARTLALLAVTLYQGIPDMNHKRWNIRSTEKHVLHMQMLLECCYIEMKSSQWEN
jgi:hypothetical protein